MRKILILALFLIPSCVSAAPVTGDYVDATDAAATSTFSGSIDIAGKYFFNSATGFFGLGTSTPANSATIMEFDPETNTSQGARYIFSQYNSGGSTPAPIIGLRSVRGTKASPSATLANDVLGRIVFTGYDGVSVPATAPLQINAFASSNWTSTSHPTFLSFSTTPSSSITPLTRLIITSQGNVGVGTNSPTSRFSVNGDTFLEGNISLDGFVNRTIEVTDATTTNGSGRSLMFHAGDGLGDGNGGSVTIEAGNGGIQGGGITLFANHGHVDGGTISIRGGIGDTGDGGDVEVQGGVGQHEGGHAYIYGGSGGDVGGDIYLVPGEHPNPEQGNVYIGQLGSTHVKFDIDSLTTGRTLAFSDQSGTFGLLEAAQTWTGANTFSAGSSATTTVTFGELGDSSSRTCFNVKNTDGNDVSFYFVGTAMVVENNVCQ